MGTTFAERLETAIAKFESVHAFSKKAEISDSMLRKYLDGSMPGLDKLIKIANAADVTLDWLAADRGPMHADGADLAIHHSDGRTIFLQAKTNRDAGLPDLTLLERLDIEASAGLGAYIETEQMLDYVAFQTTWLRKRGINPSCARILNIKGDSMEPTIRDGDVAIIDTSIREIIDNAIYVIIVGQRLLVKRIHVRVTGALRLISDNSIYTPEDVQPNEVDFVRIAGRVMWYGRSI